MHPTTDLVTDYCTPTAFHGKYPNLHSSIDSLRWELRFRAVNGLLADGVVVERRADPDASRPSLLISPSLYLERLRKSQAGAA